MKLSRYLGKMYKFHYSAPEVYPLEERTGTAFLILALQAPQLLITPI